jgi:hypothetical protein
MMLDACSLARALGGNAYGSKVVAPGPGHSRADRSLSIKIDPAAPDGFMLHSFAGDSPRECREHVLIALALDTGKRLPGDSYSTRLSSSRIASNYHEDQARQYRASWLWSQRQPVSINTPVAKYLHHRGFSATSPATVGYLPARGSHPAAMIAAFGLAAELEPGVLVPPALVSGVHLTRLRENGHKAPNAGGLAKIMVGACKGNPIVIAPPNDSMGLAVTEGIEDALSVHEATGLGVWAAGAAGFMPALAPLVPDYMESVTIFAHADIAGKHGALALAQALTRRDFEVFIEGLPNENGY